MKTRTLKDFIASSLILAVAGCTFLPKVGPDYEKPEIEMPTYDLPDASAPSTNKTARGEYAPIDKENDPRALITADDIKEWWLGFNDDVLTTLVNESVTNNRSYLMAQQRLIAARWGLFGTYSAFLPKVSGTTSFARSEQGPNVGTLGTTVHRDVYSAGFDARWEIDFFGGNSRRTESASAEEEAAIYSMADAWVSLTSEVARNYIDLRTTQQRIAVARTNLILQSETYDILKSRMDSGIGDELAVNQSKYIVDQTRAQIPPLLAQEERLKNALAILTGSMPGALHEMLLNCPERNWLIDAKRLENAPIDMIRLRPDVRSAERALAAQMAQIGVAKSMWFPKLYINGTLGLEAMKMKDFLHRGSLVGSLGPTISWAIFQGGSIIADTKVQEAKTQEKLLDYERILQEAYGEVRGAYAEYTQEYHRYQALQGAVKAAEDAVSIANDLYKNGLRDFTAVIDAQRSLLSLAEALVVSRGQITQDIIALYKSLGGGLATNEINLAE